MREFYNFSRYILKWRLLFLIVNLLVIELSFGQDPEAPYINEYIKNSNIASPDIREFEKRSFLSGNLNKGQINVNIPIYTIEQGNITYPISLIYNTGGIKIDQRASNVGLGWALSHTFITREIIGGNDFNDYGNRNDIDPNIRTKEMIAKNLNDVGKVGYFMQKANNVKLKYDGDASIDRVDFFPDIYHLSSPLFKTRFYLKDLQTPIELDYQQSKISFQPPSYKTYKYSELFTNHPFKDIFKFEIVSDKGIKYTFNEYTINYSDVLSWGTGEHTLPQVSSWLITEIYDYSSKSSIKFEYEEYDAGYGDNQIHAPDSYPFYLSFANKLPNALGGPCTYRNAFYDIPGDNFQTIKSWNKNLRQVRLKKISFDMGEIEFIYFHDRIDIYKEKALSNIIIKDYHGKIIKNYLFTHSYFTSNCDNYEFTQDCSRLKLKKVMELFSGESYELEYFEESSLPRINSGASDFLGYNNGSTAQSVNSLLNMFPKLYFYPNKREKSLLPFKISNENYHLVNKYSIISKDANNLSKIWSLKSIKYPTGGKLEVDYESGDFNFWGENVLGGGARVKTQKLYDKNNELVQSLNYEYKNLDGTSSGALNRVPFYGYPARRIFNTYSYEEGDGTYTTVTDYDGLPNWEEDELEKTFFLFSTPQNNFNGYDVEYDFVTVYEDGNGHTEYKFSSSESYPDTLSRIDRISLTLFESPIYTPNTCMSGFLTFNSGLGYRLYNDSEKLRGHLLEKTIFNEKGDTVYIEKNSYKQQLYDEYRVNGIEEYTRGFFGDVRIHLLFTSTRAYLSNNYLHSKNVITNKLLNKNISEEIKYTYKNNNNFLQKKVFETSKGDSIITKYKYPEDFENDPNLLKLISENRRNLKIQETSMYNNTEINLKLIKFLKYPDYNLTLPSSIFSGTNSNNLEEKVRIFEYDDKGNVIRYKNIDGLNNYIVMGYNKTYPIMKISGNSDDNQNYKTYYDMTQSLKHIIGISFEDIQELSNLEDDEIKENELRNKMKLIRDWLIQERDLFVEFYTYDPLLGITSHTSTNGMIEFYVYDLAGRLKQIVDHEGNVLKEFEYKYQNQP